MKIEPLRDRILIKKDKKEEKTEGGIFLPDIGQSPAQTGEVMAVGPGLPCKSGLTLPVTLKVGQKVVFPKYSGTDAKMLGEDLFIVPEHEVLAVIETINED